jgi:acyl-CoA synthetase (NDP forming)
VDTTATISREEFCRVLEHLAADDDVDAVIAIVLPTAPAPDIVTGIQEAAVGKPLAAVVLNQPQAVRLLPRQNETTPSGSIPAYAYPEAAVRALARAVRHGEWRARPHHEMPRFPDIDLSVPGILAPADVAGAQVQAFLARSPAGGWLSHAERHALLRAYGIPVAPIVTAGSEDDAVAAAAAIFAGKAGMIAGEKGAALPGLSGSSEERGAGAREGSASKAPVSGGSGGSSPRAGTSSPRASTVLKAEVPGLVHKSDAGAVLLDLRTEADVREGYRTLAARFGRDLAGVGVQPMITGGIEVMVGVADDKMFGPLVIFGLGGVASELLADHSARLAPLTADDADELIGSIRSAPLLHGHRGAPAADLDALRDVLMRVSRLADDVPEIAELDLNPVIARPDGAIAVDARIRVFAEESTDPFLRRLRLSLRMVVRASLGEGIPRDHDRGPPAERRGAQRHRRLVEGR